MMMRVGLLGLTLFLSLSCKDPKTSVNDLYKFPSLTKDVRVQVTIDYKLDAAGGPAVSVGDQSFLLNAFVYADSAEQQVAVGYIDKTPAMDLPVTLVGTHLAFDAIVRVPVALDPGEKGYSFHFSLKENSTALALKSLFLDDAQVTTTKNLESIKGGVQPGTAAASNVVPLSLATTIAYQFTKDMEINSGDSLHLDAYEGLLTNIGESLKSVESTLDSQATPDLGTYISAVLGATKLKIMNDQAFQAKIVDLLQPAVVAIKGDTEASSVIAAAFTSRLKQFAVDVKASIGTTESSESKLFKAGTIDPSTIPEPETYVSVVYAPKELAFTDTDVSTAIAGLMKVTAPASVNGIEGYNLYFGGSSIADGKTQLIATIVQGKSLTYTLTATTIPSGVTRFWVFPVVKGKDLALATSLVIVNVISSSAGQDSEPSSSSPSSPSSSTPTLTGTVVSATRIDLEWTQVTTELLYLVYEEGSTAPTSCTSAASIANSSPYQVTNLTPSTTYRFALCSTTSGSPLVTSSALTTLPNEQNEPQAAFVAPGSHSSDNFGSAVAIASDRALIGSFQQESDFDGEVYAFKLAAGVWAHTQTLSSHNNDEEFGDSIAMTYTRAIIGARLSGSAYYYEYNSSEGEWEFKHTFSGEGDAGSAVAIDDSLAVVGKPASSGSPWVRIYSGSGTSWTLVRELNDADYRILFGRSLVLTPTYLIVGAPDDDMMGRQYGSVFAYTRSSDFADGVEITEETNINSKKFGQAVAAHGTTLAVGDYYYDSSAGRVYVYTYEEGTWTKTQTLTPPTSGTRFGNAIVLQGDLMVIGAPAATNTGVSSAGLAYVYRRTSGTWSHTDTIEMASPLASEGMGGSLAMSGNILLQGNWDFSDMGYSPGTAVRVNFVDTRTLE